MAKIRFDVAQNIALMSFGRVKTGTPPSQGGSLLLTRLTLFKAPVQVS